MNECNLCWQDIDLIWFLWLESDTDWLIVAITISYSFSHMSAQVFLRLLITDVMPLLPWGRQTSSNPSCLDSWVNVALLNTWTSCKSSRSLALKSLPLNISASHFKRWVSIGADSVFLLAVFHMLFSSWWKWMMQPSWGNIYACNSSWLIVTIAWIWNFLQCF